MYKVANKIDFNIKAEINKKGYYFLYGVCYCYGHLKVGLFNTEVKMCLEKIYS